MDVDLAALGQLGTVTGLAALCLRGLLHADRRADRTIERLETRVADLERALDDCRNNR